MARTFANRFYTDFDTESREGYPRGSDYRTPFEIDRDRILHTTAFRRLQSKTQVFLSREYDLYRTRLTHSLEVAQIGRSLCAHLARSSDFLADDFFIDPDLVEAACLAHDLGHPPFGHTGERTLHELMRAHGGFEGNAQTARLLTEIIYVDGRKGSQSGMNPTRALLDAVLKYKTFLAEVPEAPNHFLYDDQRPWLEFAFADAWPEVVSIPAGKERNACRSMECQIMDWADDTAYSLNDIVDGVAVGFLSIEKIERWAESSPLTENECSLVERLLAVIRGQNIERALGRRIGDFIRASKLAERADHPLAALTNRYRFALEIDPAILEEATLYQRLAFEVVFQSQQLRQLDYKSAHILRRLFEALAAEYLADTPPGWRLLSPATERLIEAAQSQARRARLLCDALAAMTDGFVTRAYKRLFDPDFGSIVDLV